jgi:type I restriction enzyme S subunit
MKNQKTKQPKNKNIPKIRFGGFSSYWEEKKLGEITKIYDGTHQTPKYVKKGIPFFSVESLTNNNFLKTKFISEDVFEKEQKRIKIENNDILMTRIGDIGTNKLINWDVKASFYVSLALLKKTDKFISSFLSQYINTNNFQNELWKKTIHVAFPKKINLGDIGKCKIKFPSLEEQNKIAGFLGGVDEWIEDLKKQKECLEKYKKGIMQKIFPAKNKKVPELRFDGFSGEWEEKKLGEVCKIKTGKLDANAMEENGKYRFYTCAKEFYKINDFAFDTEALLVSGNGANVGYIHYFKGKFNAYQRTYVLDDFSENIIYIKYLLEKRLKNRINKEKKEGNTPYIVLGTLSKMDLNLPSIKEQNKIAEFLTNIDNLIKIKQEQISKAQTWKKGLIQGMFV